MNITRSLRVPALAAAVAAATLIIPTTSAHAVSGSAAADSAYAFTARLDIGSGDTSRACSGALVKAGWVLTAASCFADDPATSISVPAGPPALTTTATIGRTDLTGAAGQVRTIVELVPDPGQDVVLARLSSPVTDIKPVALATSAPTAGEELQVAGYGRTKDEWAPLKLHTGAFTLDTVDATELDITGEDGAAVCKGDTGGPLLRDTGGSVQLVGVNSRSWQGGCFGSDATDTSTGAIDTRVDALSDWTGPVLRPSRHDFTDNSSPDLLLRDTSGKLWLQNITHRSGLGLTASTRQLIGSGWGQYSLIEAVGDIGGTAMPDIVARDTSGVLWFYEGRGDGTFVARTQIGGGWNVYDELAGGDDLTGDGRPDLLATDTAGALWLYKGTGNAAAPYAPKVKVGLSGWQSFDQLNIAGDIAGSPAADAVARDTSGNLWLFEGKGDGTFLPRTEIGPSIPGTGIPDWSPYTSIIACGDFNGSSGVPDLLAFEPDGTVVLHQGTGNDSAPLETAGLSATQLADAASYNLVV